MMNDIITLIEATPDWMTNGVFSKLDEKAVPWKDLGIASMLDLDYYGNHSGDKITSPLVDRLIDDETLTDEAIQKLADICWMRYGENWTRLWDALQLEYNPIHNYDQLEKETIDDTSTLTKTISNTSQRNASGTMTSQNTSSVNSNEANDVFGFNSTTGKPSTKSTGSSSSTNDSSGSTSGNETVTLSGSDVDDKTGKIIRELTRQGNIGVTTTQQMLESEYEFRKHVYFDFVYETIDSVLTITIY